MLIRSDAYRSTLRKLKEVRNRELLAATVTSFLQALIAVTCLVLIASAAEMVLYFSRSIREAMFFSLTIGGSAILLLSVAVPLLKFWLSSRSKTEVQYAQRVGNALPEVKDELTNFLQLASLEGKGGYSPALVSAAFTGIYRKIEHTDFTAIIPLDGIKKLFRVTIATLMLTGLLFLLISPLQFGLYRIYAYTTLFVPPAGFVFDVTPGDASITKGENFTVTVKVLGKDLKRVTLMYKDISQTDFTGESITPDSMGVFRYTLHSVRNPLSYYVTAEDIESERYTVEVTDLPVIRSFTVSVTPPGYSRLQGYELTDNGNITGLAGSTVRVRLRANKDLSAAMLRFTDSAITNLQVNGNFAEGSFRLSRNNQYVFRLLDQLKKENPSPVSYTVQVTPDAYPSLEVVEPDQKINLGPDQRLNTLFRLKDDFGFSKLVLHYRLTASRYEPAWETFKSITIPVPSGTPEAEVRYVWNLTEMYLGTEDAVSFYFELFDNDVVSGPKSVKSAMYSLRVPSLEEIMQRADTEQESVEKELEQVLKEAEALRKDLEKIDNTLKQEKKEPDWQEKQDIQKALDRFEELQQKTEELSKQLDETRQELQENQLLSEKTLEKYLELQEVMKELSSDEMKKAMERLQQSLENMDRRQLQEQMKNFKMDEDAFRKSVERTLNLLKRIRVEQKMDELLKRTDELMKQQEQNEERLNNSDLKNQQQKDALQKQQDQISKDLKSLKEEMETLQKQMEEIEDMPAEDAQEMLEEFEQQQNEELSEKTSDQMQKGEKQQAQKNMQQLQKNMKQMRSKMEKMQQSMMQANQMQTMQDMMKLIDNILVLSKQQEELRNQTLNKRNSAQILNEEIRKQDELDRGVNTILNQMGELAQKTFAVSPEMGKALGDAKRNMSAAITGMQNRNNSGAAGNQELAMKALNQAAVLMQNAMQSMMQSGGQGSGMMSLMQQLGQLSGQQMSLNNMTQQLQQAMQQGGTLSQQQMGQMQRLAQQQEVIRKSLEQLNKEAEATGKSKSMTADLDRVLKEMQEVVSDMNTQKLTDDLVQKQERILSKLLDAQRSLNQRDFEKDRESNTAVNVTRQSPAELMLDPKRKQDAIRQELEKALKEGYAKDYEQLIRLYFESLQGAR